MSKKDCMLQVVIDGQVVVDTDRMTRDDADELWRARKHEVIEAIERGDRVEAVLWIDCKTDSSYGDAAWHIRSDECVVHDGKVWRLEPLP